MFALQFPTPMQKWTETEAIEGPRAEHSAPAPFLTRFRSDHFVGETDGMHDGRSLSPTFK